MHDLLFDELPGVRVTGTKKIGGAIVRVLPGSVGSALPADTAASDTPVPI
jgi:hypothetical protein